MLSKDLIPGDLYSRRTRRGVIKVTVVETDPEACGRGKVRVRVEEGVSMGKEVLVLCRDIIAPWGQKRAPAAPRTPRRPLLRLEWPPRIGDVVQIKGAGKLEWIVTGITGDSYELETDVFTRRQRRTEPLENLEPSNSSQGAERVAPDELIEQVLPPSAVEEEGDGEVQSFAAVEASGEGALASIHR